MGIENAYTIMFILSVAGGLTAFSGIPYHVVLVSFATGGLNPLVLGSVTALGVMLGDSTSYALGYQGRAIAPPMMQRWISTVYERAARDPYALWLFCLGYGSLVPFSNDFITISAGMARYPFWRIMIPLGIGNAIFNIGLALAAIYASDAVYRFF